MEMISKTRERPSIFLCVCTRLLGASDLVHIGQESQGQSHLHVQEGTLVHDGTFTYMNFVH